MDMYYKGHTSSLGSDILLYFKHGRIAGWNNQKTEYITSNMCVGYERRFSEKNWKQMRQVVQVESVSKTSLMII